MIDIVYKRPNAGKKPIVSFIFLDWSCRESFHSLDYLNTQNIDRNDYEIIWVEYYNYRSSPLDDKLASYATKGATAPIDLWTILRMEKGLYYHKHLMYNVGLIQSRGDIIIICDSDAMFPENFVETVIKTFDENPNTVVHFDEVRNSREDFYPFNYPSFDDITGRGAINWRDGKTTGLWDTIDPLHSRNYGACFCARRSDLIAIGGADEHLDYLGHVCGPYELTFRLANKGLHEVWHDNVFIYHTWHPGSDGEFNYIGPSDGRHMSSTALEARNTGRVLPLLENAAIRALREGRSGDLPPLIDPTYSVHWTQEAVSRSPRFKLFKQGARAPKLVMTVGTHNIVEHAGKYYGVPHALGPVDLSKEEEQTRLDIIQGTDLEKIKASIAATDAVEAAEIEIEVELIEQSHPAALNGAASIQIETQPRLTVNPTASTDASPTPQREGGLGQIADELMKIVTQRQVDRDAQNQRLLRLEEGKIRRQKALEKLDTSTETPDRAIAALKNDVAHYQLRIAELEREASLWREQALRFTAGLELLPLLNRKEFSIDTGTDVSVLVNSEAGHFLFGPYLPLRAGLYELRVVCHASRVVDENAPVLTVEIADRSEVFGARILSAAECGSEFVTDFCVPSEPAEEERKVEFRFSHHGNGNISVSSVKLRFTGDIENSYSAAQNAGAPNDNGRAKDAIRFFPSPMRYLRGEHAS